MQQQRRSPSPGDPHRLSTVLETTYDYNASGSRYSPYEHGPEEQDEGYGDERYGEEHDYGGRERGRDEELMDQLYISSLTLEEMYHLVFFSSTMRARARCAY